VTVKEAIRAIRALGLSVRRTEFREFRVSLPGGAEATAYYTTDAEDAVWTARSMAHWAADRR
jgi:hypothetical protein